jgi:hypothetical protein
VNWGFLFSWKKKRGGVPEAVISEKQYQLPTMQGAYWVVVSVAEAARSDGEESSVGVASVEGRYARKARYGVAWKICIVLNSSGGVAICREASVDGRAIYLPQF